MPRPLRASIPFYAGVAVRHCAPAPIGNDANDGLDDRYPKEHILACYDDLPSTGGIIKIAPGTYVGGEVQGQGLWFTAGTLHAGWRTCKPVLFEGNGHGPLTGQFGQPQAQVLRGRATDVSQPSVRFDVGVWITNNGGVPMKFKDLFFLNFSIGNRMAVDGNTLLNPDLPAQRGSAQTVSGIYYENVCWQNNGNGSDTGQGPMIDCGYFLLCGYDSCAVNSNPTIAPLTDNRRASWLVNPGDGTSQLDIRNCQGTHSGIIYYNGASSWGFTIDKYTIESDGSPLPSVVKLVGLNSVGQGYIRHIEGNDASPSPLLIDNSGSINRPSQLIVYQTSLGACAGPMTVFGTNEDNNLSNIVSAPSVQDQMGCFRGKWWGDMDHVRFPLPVITNRFRNMMPQLSGSDGLSGSVVNPTTIGNSSNRVWTQSGATGDAGVVNSPIADRRGTNTAIQISTNNSSAAFARLFQANQAAAVGDIWICGAWVRIPLGSVIGGPILSMTLTSGTITEEDHASSLFTDLGPTGQWQFTYGWAKILTVSGGSPMAATNFVVNAYNNCPVQIDSPFLIKIPASLGLSPSEFHNIRQNLQSYVQAAVGAAVTQPGQLLVGMGGLGAGNSIATTGHTFGAATNAIEVFDALGNSLGWALLQPKTS